MNLTHLFRPKLQQSVLVESLIAEGRVISSDSDKLQVKCPRCNGEAEYWLPNHLVGPYGAWDCPHCHATVFSVLDEYNLHESDAVTDPSFFYRRGEQESVTGLIAEELKKTSLFYRYQKTLRRIEILGGKVCDEICTSSTLERDINCLYRVFVFDARSKRYRPVDSTKIFGEKILKAYSGIYDEVISIVSQPSIRKHGNLNLNAGYDPETKLFCNFDPKNFKDLDNRTVSHDEAKNAYKFLNSLLDEIPFEREQDRLATLSALFTAVFRAFVTAAPFIFVDAKSPGSGKSTLCRALIRLNNVEIPGATSYSNDETKLHMDVFSTLRSRMNTLYLDNINVEVQATQTMCSLITEPSIVSRVVRTSNVERVSTKLFVIGNGNGGHISADMVRRTLPINLDKGLYHKFTHSSLEEVVIHRRDEIIHAVYAIYVAYCQAGSEKIKEALPSFEEWDNYCRAPLLWISGQDPVENIFEALERQKEMDPRFIIVEELYRLFGSTSFSVKLIQKRSTSLLVSQLKRLSLADQKGINSKKMGRWLIRRIGEEIGPYRISRTDKAMHASMYLIEKAGEQDVD